MDKGYVHPELDEDFSPFPCDKCGLCCEHLSGAALYKDLDNGTGTCRYFNRQTRLCSIYEKRPQKCDINAAYVWFQAQMSYDEYRQMNIDACQKLKEVYLCHYHS